MVYVACRTINLQSALDVYGIDYGFTAVPSL